MRIKMILNPIAGRGRGGRTREALLDVLQASGVEYDVAVTGQRGAGRLLARQAVADGYDLIVAGGGDGTVNEVVNGMAGSHAALGVVPLGTGNDFAAMMGMPKDPVASLERILRGERLAVDLCRVNDRYFASSVGAGFDGEVAYTANHGFKHLRGMVVYILAVFKAVFGYRPRRVRLSIDGGIWEGEITLVTVVNSRTYGAGMLVAPDAVADDGLFDICRAEKMSPLRIIMMLPKFIKGTHPTMPEITMSKGRDIWLESTTPLYCQVDGEVIEESRLVFRLIPGGLIVAGANFVPTRQEAAPATAGERGS
ncbi:MAG: diacylglycerol/lipid kinase family protein [Patescibacteria group bacterium]